LSGSAERFHLRGSGSRKTGDDDLPESLMSDPATLSLSAEDRALLARIAEALERLAPPHPVPSADLDAADAFAWRGAEDRLIAVRDTRPLPLDLLVGIDRQKAVLLDNTLSFARARPANNALLWGARGTGKSSLVKSVHAAVNAQQRERLALVEIQRDEIPRLAELLDRMRLSARRFILFCDDLSFDEGESQYKSLKALLEGGVEGRPDNVLFYATSNRRHLLARSMVENEQSTAINPGDAVDEKVSLSDRFGLWIGFHAIDQETYLAMVAAYLDAYKIEIEEEDLRRQALQWAMERGARSGRVAWQFVQQVRARQQA
jgi:predicted AAA+ superfamily ATPase